MEKWWDGCSGQTRAKQFSLASFISSEDAAGVWEAAAESGSLGPGAREEQEHGDGKRLVPST